VAARATAATARATAEDNGFLGIISRTHKECASKADVVGNCLQAISIVTMHNSSICARAVMQGCIPMIKAAFEAHGDVSRRVAYWTLNATGTLCRNYSTARPEFIAAGALSWFDATLKKYFADEELVDTLLLNLMFVVQSDAAITSTAIKLGFMSSIHSALTAYPSNEDIQKSGLRAVMIMMHCTSEAVVAAVQCGIVTPATAALNSFVSSAGIASPACLVLFHICKSDDGRGQASKLTTFAKSLASVAITHYADESVASAAAVSMMSYTNENEENAESAVAAGCVYAWRCLCAS
jgi:hypothetical protein